MIEMARASLEVRVILPNDPNDPDLKGESVYYAIYFAFRRESVKVPTKALEAAGDESRGDSRR